MIDQATINKMQARLAEEARLEHLECLKSMEPEPPLPHMTLVQFRPETGQIVGFMITNTPGVSPPKGLDHITVKGIASVHTLHRTHKVDVTSRALVEMSEDELAAAGLQQRLPSKP